MNEQTTKTATETMSFTLRATPYTRTGPEETFDYEIPITEVVEDGEVVEIITRFEDNLAAWAAAESRAKDLLDAWHVRGVRIHEDDASRDGDRYVYAEDEDEEKPE